MHVSLKPNNKSTIPVPDLAHLILFATFSSNQNFITLLRHLHFGDNKTNSFYRIKASSHDTISCTWLLRNSLICKLCLWVQHKSTKETYDSNRIELPGLYSNIWRNICINLIRSLHKSVKKWQPFNIAFT